jgi:hypothetical protein
MEPITGSDGNRSIFGVGHDDSDLWLDWNYGNPDDVWGAVIRFVFVLRKKN